MSLSSLPLLSPSSIAPLLLLSSRSPLPSVQHLSLRPFDLSSLKGGQPQPLLIVTPSFPVDRNRIASVPSFFKSSRCASFRHFPVRSHTTSTLPPSSPEPPSFKPPLSSKIPLRSPVRTWLVRALSPFLGFLNLRGVAMGEWLYRRASAYVALLPPCQGFNLIVDERLRQSPLKPLLIFVFHHGISQEIAMEEVEKGKLGQSTRFSPLVDKARVNQAFLEAWWNDLTSALGETVGGLRMNKHLMLAQNRLIGLFQTLEMAMYQSDADECSTWVRSILARHFYNIADKEAIEGRTAVLVTTLSDWLLDAVKLVDSVKSIQTVASGKIPFPTLTVPVDNVKDETAWIQVYPFEVRDNRLLKLTPKEAQLSIERLCQ